MVEIDKRIIKFINRHHVLVLATAQDNIPYTCACFYAYSKERNCFIFSSDFSTKHAQQIMLNKKVAANIFLETQKTGKIQGLQLSGIVELLENEALEKEKKLYIKKYPFTLLMTINLWAFYPNYMKLTDNRLGFGTKLIWNQNNA